MSLLDIRALSASYGPTKVLHGIDLSIRAGGVSALLGANGAGKTTTLRAVCNMMVKLAGEVHFAGRRIDQLATEDIVRLGIAHVPDGRGTFNDLSVQENLRLGAYTRRDPAGVATDLERVFDYFPRLRERSQQQAGTLSGGEQQMLAISRALMLRPKLLLLDEPSFGLAPVVVQDIFRILRRINAEDGVSMLLVEQNANLALGIASDAFLLETGRIVMSGAAEELKNNDSVRRAYLGL